MVYIDLFLTFFKIGAFSFGGGYAMISILQQEAVNNNWLTTAEFTEIVAISQITPGPLAVNMATFVGFRLANVAGAFFATLGVCLPSFIITIIIAKYFFKFHEHRMVKRLFAGLRPAVCGLILAAAIQIAMLEFFTAVDIASIDIKSILIFVVAIIGVYKFKINPIVAICASGVIGLIVF